MDRTLALVRAFRAADDATPIVLMGYYNPIYSRGVAALPRRGQGRRRRRPHRRRPAARGGRGALPARAGRGPELHPPRDADDRRPPPAAGAHQHLGLRLLRLDHRHHRRRRRQRRRRRPRGRPHQGARRRCRSASASASAPPRPPPRSPRVADGAVVGSAIVERIGAGEPPAAVLAFVASLAEAAHRRSADDRRSVHDCVNHRCRILAVTGGHEGSGSHRHHRAQDAGAPGARGARCSMPPSR